MMTTREGYRGKKQEAFSVISIENGHMYAATNSYAIKIPLEDCQDLKARFYADKNLTQFLRYLPKDVRVIMIDQVSEGYLISGGYRKFYVPQYDADYPDVEGTVFKNMTAQDINEMPHHSGYFGIEKLYRLSEAIKYLDRSCFYSTHEIRAKEADNKLLPGFVAIGKALVAVMPIRTAL